MGMEFKDDSVSGGLRVVRRTEACAVCRTVFLDDWPTSTTHCGRCGGPLCATCVAEHRCRDDQEMFFLQKRREEFYNRFGRT